MKIPATRHLDDLERRLEAIGRRTRELTSDLREEQLLWRPEPKRWGIADCFEHLLVADAPERFLADQEVVAELLADARDVDLQGAKLTSPVTSLLRLTLGEALTLLVSHQERHLGQAEAVRRAPGFPA